MDEKTCGINYEDEYYRQQERICRLTEQLEKSNELHIRGYENFINIVGILVQSDYKLDVEKVYKEYPREHESDYIKIKVRR